MSVEEHIRLIVDKEDLDAAGWYFYDEVGADKYGPFPNRDAARREMLKYAWQELEGIDLFQEGTVIRPNVACSCVVDIIDDFTHAVSALEYKACDYIMGPRGHIYCIDTSGFIEEARNVQRRQFGDDGVHIIGDMGISLTPRDIRGPWYRLKKT